MSRLRSGFRFISFLFYIFIFVVNVTVLYDYRDAIACRLGLYCPVIHGEVDPKFSRVRSMYETLWANGTEQIGSQLVVYRGTKKVVDLWGAAHSGSSYSGDSLQTIWSCSKVIESVVVAMFVDRGLLDYDAPIATYWFEFGQKGKDKVTLRDLMQHSAGLTFTDDRDASTDDQLPLFEGYPDYLDRIARIFERSYLHFPESGKTKLSYHGMTRGLVLNEIIRRVDPRQRTIGKFVQEEISGPLGIDLFIGSVPESKFPLIANHSLSSLSNLKLYGNAILRILFGRFGIPGITPLPSSPQNITNFSNGHIFSSKRALKQLIDPNSHFTRICTTMSSQGISFFGIYGPFCNVFAFVELHNSRIGRTVESPSSNGLSNARSLAKIAALILNRGELNGVRLLSEAGWKKATRKGMLTYDASLDTPGQFTDAGWGVFEGVWNHWNGYMGWHGFGGGIFMWSESKRIAFSYTSPYLSPHPPWSDVRTSNLMRTVMKCVEEEETK